MRTNGKLREEMDGAFRYRYRLDYFAGSWTHNFVVEGRDGAIHFHVTDCLYDGRHSCGLEMHSTTPTDDKPPDHARCPALSDRACWHDGTSLYAEEKILPMWLELRNSPDAFFGLLVTEYRRRFGAGKEDVPKPRGISRVADAPKCIMLTFDRELTDDEMRRLHDGR